MNILKLQKAFTMMRDATLQGHSAHWDPTMEHDQNCPACNRARALRIEADKLWTEGLNE